MFDEILLSAVQEKIRILFGEGLKQIWGEWERSKIC
jgi:hypothetical protein